jgi:hypothetical protein
MGDRFFLLQVLQAMWTLNDDSAQLNQQRLSARLTLDQLSTGLLDASFEGEPLGWNKWLSISDRRQKELSRHLGYVRGDDLVCYHAGEPGTGTTRETSWRVLGMASGAVGIELLMSVQDNPPWDSPIVSVGTAMAVDACFLLDAESHRWSSFDMTTGQVSLAAPQGILCCWPNRVFSYFEMLHPTDHGGVELSTGEQGSGDLAWRWDLLHRQLEKGVIRRSRLQGWFIPSEGDQQIAGQLFEQFQEAACRLG